MRAGRTGSWASLPGSLCSAPLVWVCALATVISGCYAIDCFLNFDAIIRQRRACGSLELHFRLLIRGIGVHLVELGKGEVALGRKRLEGRPGTQFLFLLHDGEGLLGK